VDEGRRSLGKKTKISKEFSKGKTKYIIVRYGCPLFEYCRVKVDHIHHRTWQEMT
jgi:hypothetical protein